jgi:hypothetical protein
MLCLAITDAMKYHHGRYCSCLSVNETVTSKAVTDCLKKTTIDCQ